MLAIVALLIALAGWVSPADFASSGRGARGTETPRTEPRRAHAVRLRVLVTAYCLRGRTFSGTRAGYGTVAVDPHVIRLGSRLFVPHYGYAYALDTGSAVQGHHVDEWRSSCADAMRRTRFETITVWRHR